MTDQHLYGYRLSHEDGSQSKWVFINRKDDLLDISIKLRNGANYHFAEYHGDEFIGTWAYNHGFKIMRSVFIFDQDKMTFKLLTMEED